MSAPASVGHPVGHAPPLPGHHPGHLQQPGPGQLQPPQHWQPMQPPGSSLESRQKL